MQEFQISDNIEPPLTQGPISQGKAKSFIGFLLFNNVVGDDLQMWFWTLFIVDIATEFKSEGRKLIQDLNPNMMVFNSCNISYAIY